ncbi:hypothetical protein L1987_20285 [Smallanthus sonchifolius]|uniref:Uncharacterized protein n=1 Tax=Smallanthus sonchifolius TaxID=185202 RepID=A0ACB9IT33_9ASTR|nr:hypothetical protein L1987_20285 [Smallanthus sonchifolius]
MESKYSFQWSFGSSCGDKEHDIRFWKLLDLACSFTSLDEQIETMDERENVVDINEEGDDSSEAIETDHEE